MASKRNKKRSGILGAMRETAAGLVRAGVIVREQLRMARKGRKSAA
jgi:hypothetical protein